NEGKGGATWRRSSPQFEHVVDIAGRSARRPGLAALGLELLAQMLGLAPPMPFAAAMMPLGEPGGNAAEQHADQQDHIKNDEKRNAIAIDARFERGGEGIEIDADKMAIGQGEGDQQSAERHQDQPADDSVDHMVCLTAGVLAVTNG